MREIYTKFSVTSLIAVAIFVACMRNYSPFERQPPPPPPAALEAPAQAAETDRIDDGVFSIAAILDDFAAENYNKGVLNGLANLKEKLDAECFTLKAGDIGQLSSYLDMLSETGKYDVVLVPEYVGKTAEFTHEAVKLAAEKYPAQMYEIFDGAIETDAQNIRTIGIEKGEMSFLAGVYAGLKAKEGGFSTIGFIGECDNPKSRSALYGFVAGARYILPEAAVDYSFTGEARAPQKARKLADAAYSRGTKIIFDCSGDSGIGIFESKESQQDDGFEIIETNCGEPPEAEKGFIAITDIAGIVFEAASSYENGKASLGIKTGICNFEIIGDDDMKEAVSDIRAKILADEIEVSEFYDKAQSALEKK